MMVPPMMAQKPIGISSRESGISVRVEIRETTGRNNAVAPTFCIRLEIPPTVPDINGMILLAVLPPIRNMKAATTVITPVLSRPAPSIMTAIMEITALEAKPLNNWSDGTRPSKPTSTMIDKATTSTLTTSNTNRTMVITSTVSTIIMSPVSVRLVSMLCYSSLV